MVDHVPSCCVPTNILSYLRNRYFVLKLVHVLHLSEKRVSLLLGTSAIAWGWIDVGGYQVGRNRRELGTRRPGHYHLFRCVTDGSYNNREKAKTVSNSGWIITCMSSHRTLRGLFFEISNEAGSYRGELLGPAALHTFVSAVTQFYSIYKLMGRICCDNIAALNRSSKNRRQVSTGIQNFLTFTAQLSIELLSPHVFPIKTRMGIPGQDGAVVVAYSGGATQYVVICNKLAKNGGQLPLAATTRSSSSSTMSAPQTN